MREQQNSIRRYWELLTPYIQVVGFLIVCVFISGGLYSKFDAYGATLIDQKSQLLDHDRRISDNDRMLALVNQKLDDIIFYFNVPHRK